MKPTTHGPAPARRGARRAGRHHRGAARGCPHRADATPPARGDACAWAPLVVELGFATERAGRRRAGRRAVARPRRPRRRCRCRPTWPGCCPQAVAERHLVLPIARDENGRRDARLRRPDERRRARRRQALRRHQPTSSVVGRQRGAGARPHRPHLVAVRGQRRRRDDARGPRPATTPTSRTTDDAVVDAPTVRLVNAILADAVRARASDIHVEPQAARGAHPLPRRRPAPRRHDRAPRRGAPGIVSRIKVIEQPRHRRAPAAAGRPHPAAGRRRRRSTRASARCRTSHGEKVVIRLLAKADSVPPLTKIGMGEKQLESLLGTLVAPQGLVLITGPTGSGKTQHALQRDPPDQDARPQHRHARGPGRDAGRPGSPRCRCTSGPA